MAIEQLGESLLSNVRARNDQIARENRKRDRKDAIMAIGTQLAVGVGNQMLSDRASEFLQNEQFLASNALFKSAFTAKQNIADERARINKSGKTELAYYEDQFRPQFETLYKQNMGDLDQYGTQAYDAQITDEVRKLAQQRVDAFLKAETAASKINDVKTITSENAKAISKARPSDVGSFITRGITSLFSGKDQEQRDKEALASIMQYNTNREFAINAAQEFDRTDNLVQAYDFAKLVTPKTADDDRYQSKTTYEVKTYNDVAYLVEQEIQEDRFGVKPDIQGKPKLSVLFDEDDQTVNSKLLGSSMSSYNLSDKPQSLLTRTAYSEFVQAVHDKGIVLGNIKTYEEYSTVASILQGFTQKEVNLKDPEKSKMVSTVLSSLVSNSIDLRKTLTTGTPDEVVASISKLNAVADMLSDMTKGSTIQLSVDGNGVQRYVLYDVDGNAIREISEEEFTIN